MALVETKKRSLGKTITYKILAMAVSYSTAFFFTQSKETAFFVMIANSISTLVAFYIHERVWSKISWNCIDGKDTQKRTITKTVTYRIWGFTVGTLTRWAIVGNFMTALSIGVVKNIINAGVYYVNDRAWNRFKWGMQDKD